MSTTLAESSQLSISSSSNRAATAWVDRQLNPARARAIEEHAGDSLLDVGCGNGRYVLHYARTHETTGLDLQSYPQWDEDPERFHVGDAADLPFDDNSFDTVCCFETLEHVPDPAAVLKELHRVCRRNVIVTVPNCELPPALTNSRLTYYHYTDRSHVNFFTHDSLGELVAETGFTKVQTEGINACPLQPLIDDLLQLPRPLSRLVGRVAGRRTYHMTLLATAEKC